ncbi:MAG: hypothetical protein QW076_03875 [Candidatus Anstonellales archaeon]
MPKDTGKMSDKMDSAELQQRMNSLLATAQYFQSQQQLLNNQIQLLTSAILRVEYMLKTISTYGDDSIRFANLGNNIYVPYTQPEHDLGLIIELGAEYYAHVQKGYAIEYLQNRKMKLEQNLEKAKSLSDSIQEKLNQINQEAERLINSNRK